MPSGRSWAVKAAKASAWIAISLSGLPATRNDAVGELEVVLAHLQLVGGERPGLVDHLVGGHHDGRAAHRQRPRPVGVHAGRRDGGVAVQHLDVVGAHAELVGDQHRPRGLVALAVGRGAGDHLHGAGGQHPHGGGLPAAGAVAERRQHPARRQAAHLDVGGEAEAELHGVAAPPGGRPGRPCARPSARGRGPSRGSGRSRRCRTPARPRCCTGTPRWG